MGGSTEARWDVAVVGGGPAGAAAAIAAARAGLVTALLESSHYERSRLGETLSPAAAPILARLGLPMPSGSEATTSFGNESAWGDPELTAKPFIFDPRGVGAHLDRARFDATLADAAQAAGATVLRGARVAGCESRTDGSLRLAVGTREASASAAVFATGRNAVLPRLLGGRRHLRDRLIGIAVEYGGAGDDGTTLIESVRDGWWYSASLPSGNRVVTLMTDPDICRARQYTEPANWAAAVATTRHTDARLSGLTPLAPPRVVSAASHRLDRGGGRGRWLAAGDAAMAVDPLAGNGLTRALLSGEAAGTAIAHWLLGRHDPAHAYERWLNTSFTRYKKEHSDHYALERRWPDEPFWRRRLRFPEHP